MPTPKQKTEEQANLDAKLEAYELFNDDHAVELPFVHLVIVILAIILASAILLVGVGYVTLNIIDHLVGS